MCPEADQRGVLGVCVKNPESWFEITDTSGESCLQSHGGDRPTFLGSPRSNVYTCLLQAKGRLSLLSACDTYRDQEPHDISPTGVCSLPGGRVLVSLVGVLEKALVKGPSGFPMFLYWLCPGTIRKG